MQGRRALSCPEICPAMICMQLRVLNSASGELEVPILNVLEKKMCLNYPSITNIIITSAFFTSSFPKLINSFRLINDR